MPECELSIEIVHPELGNKSLPVRFTKH
jgi:hypothetical protein